MASAWKHGVGILLAPVPGWCGRRAAGGAAAAPSAAGAGAAAAPAPRRAAHICIYIYSIFVVVLLGVWCRGCARYVLGPFTAAFCALARAIFYN
jgi:hypothetical protein